MYPIYPSRIGSVRERTLWNLWFKEPLFCTGNLRLKYDNLQAKCSFWRTDPILLANGEAPLLHLQYIVRTVLLDAQLTALDFSRKQVIDVMAVGNVDLFF